MEWQLTKLLLDANHTSITAECGNPLLEYAKARMESLFAFVALHLEKQKEKTKVPQNKQVTNIIFLLPSFKSCYLYNMHLYHFYLSYVQVLIL